MFVTLPSDREFMWQLIRNITSKLKTYFRQLIIDNVRDVSFTGFDHVVLTPPAREIRQMKFSPRLPYDKKIALDALNYFGSVKIFLKFSRPFWSERNKIPIIHYNSTSRRNGGTGISDDILRIVYRSFFIQTLQLPLFRLTTPLTLDTVHLCWPPTPGNTRQTTGSAWVMTSVCRRWPVRGPDNVVIDKSCLF